MNVTFAVNKDITEAEVLGKWIKTKEGSYLRPIKALNEDENLRYYEAELWTEPSFNPSHSNGYALLLEKKLEYKGEYLNNAAKASCERINKKRIPEFDGLLFDKIGDCLPENMKWKSQWIPYYDEDSRNEEVLEISLDGVPTIMCRVDEGRCLNAELIKS